MKIKVHLRYPEIITTDTEKIINIPDGENPREWVEGHEEEILRDDGAADDAIEYALDGMFKGGVKFVEVFDHLK